MISIHSEKLHIIIYSEDDGTVTAVIDELDLTANARNEEQVIQQLAEDAIEYANEYYDQFSYWHSAPNRRHHLAYVLAILACESDKVSKELFICQDSRQQQPDTSQQPPHDHHHGYIHR